MTRCCRGRNLLVVGALVAGTAVAACGSVGPQHHRITFRGAIDAVYTPGPPASCGPEATMVTGPTGPDHTRDVADLTVSNSGAVTVDAPFLGGVFSGGGVSFHPGDGWDIDASLTSPSGQRLQVSGHLSC